MQWPLTAHYSFCFANSIERGEHTSKLDILNLSPGARKKRIRLEYMLLKREACFLR